MAAALAFAQGDPQGLQQLTNAEWAKLSFNEVWRDMLPRSLRAYFAAFTRNGLWNDGS
jgi:hypothetical protein